MIDEERRAVRLGAVVLVLLTAAVVFVAALKDRIELGAKTRFTVRFAHAGALHAGAKVVVAGQAIGEVEGVGLAPAREGDRGGAGAVAWIAIDADRRDRVPVDGEFFVSSRGLLSDRFLEVGPPADGRAPGRPIADGDEVSGIEPPSMDQTLQHAWQNLEIARTFAAEVAPEGRAFFEQVRALRAQVEAAGPLGEAWLRLGIAANELVDAAEHTWDDVIGGGAGLRAIGAATRNVDVTLAHVRGALDDLGRRWHALRAELVRVGDLAAARAPDSADRLRASIATIEAAAAKLDPLRAKIDDVLAWIERGQGTIGKLAKDPEFPEDAKELGKILKRTPWRVVGHPDDEADDGAAIAP